jgi:pimeloyl-ACP methyl ester carboxylesterase
MRGVQTIRLLVAAMLAAPLAVGITTAQAGSAQYPVVLIHGWTGSGSSFNTLVTKLQAAGAHVVDFDPNTAGVQAMSYAPTSSSQHIPYIACKIVQQKIKTALQQNGYDPNTQKIDVVAHSMGGLVARFLIEKPGADVDYWNSRGWYGDGTADCDTNWASRIDDLVMLGTPNHGTWEGWVPGTIGGFGVWNSSGGDMQPGSTFLTKMGYAEPAGETYSCIGGNPSYGGFLLYDYTGDGVKHGFDGVVPAESPYVTGCTFDLVSSNHGELLTQDAPIDLVLGDLGYGAQTTTGGTKRLHGTSTIRLEYASIQADHDPGTDDENRFDVYVDPDGGNDGYTFLGTISYDRDAPFTQNWGNTGPTAPNTITLPGTSGIMDVKVAAWESDPFSDDTIGTAYFRNLTLSDDKNGQDYYQATFPDASGGATDTLRISVNGVTADPMN